MRCISISADIALWYGSNDDIDGSLSAYQIHRLTKHKTFGHLSNGMENAAHVQ